MWSEDGAGGLTPSSVIASAYMESDAAPYHHLQLNCLQIVETPVVSLQAVTQIGDVMSSDPTPAGVCRPCRRTLDRS